jgi:hypothetical protein
MCESRPADFEKLAGSSGHEKKIKKLWLVTSRQVTQADHVHGHRCLRQTLCERGGRVTTATPELTQERSDERALA